MVTLVRGTKDLFGLELQKQKKIINIASHLAKLYNFLELQTPIIEKAELFLRNLGENSDVVSKEIYTFLDKKNEPLALRPEFTACVMRHILSIDQRILSRNKPYKLFSFGSLFRYDRPQAGRQRQFTQINFEALNVDSYLYDAEVISLAKDILDKLEIFNYIIEINSLGSKDSKAKYQDILLQYFSKYEKDLSPESIARLSKNPLRILDSKNEHDQKICKTAPLISESWNKQDIDNFNNIKRLLDDLGIKYIHNEKLVRGLDYYNGLIFEFITDSLGAQSSILGGGRYDTLYENMSNGDNVGGIGSLSAVGFAAGVERLANMMHEKENLDLRIAILPISSSEYLNSFNIAKILRKNDFITEVITDGKKIHKKLELSANLNCSYAIIVGEDEVKNNLYSIKKLNSKEDNLQNLTIKELIEQFLLIKKQY